MHVQCKLRRVNGAQTDSWIPLEHAVLGKFVKLKERGEWTNGWEVIEGGTIKRDSKIVQERSTDHKKHRDATDV